MASTLPLTVHLLPSEVDRTAPLLCGWHRVVLQLVAVACGGVAACCSVAAVTEQLHLTNAGSTIALQQLVAEALPRTTHLAIESGLPVYVELVPALDRALAYLGQMHGDLPGLFPSGFLEGLCGYSLSGGTFLLAELVLLLVLEFLPGLTSDFASRKICHAGTGLLMLMLNAHHASSRAAVWLIGASSILMTWNVTKAIGIKPFRFGSEKDVGITVYLIVVMAWFFMQFPAAALSPMFFADPSGAVVGKFLTKRGWWNPAWYKNKTVGGSVAVLAVTAATLHAFFPPMPLWSLLVLSVAAALAEALGDKYDNLCLAAVVIGGYRLLVSLA